VLFLPIFFAYTGLRTSVGLVTGGEMWFYCVLILLAAVVGKLAGSAIASRVAGLGWRDSIALGVLMNTRGLMELVILNIGLDLGVISPALFSMMVIMALATTFMTTPMLELIYPAKAIRAEQSAAVRKNYAYTETW
jgi:Kef-type K+ transport system membrane component KefB